MKLLVVGCSFRTTPIAEAYGCVTQVTQPV